VCIVYPNLLLLCYNSPNISSRSSSIRSFQVYHLFQPVSLQLLGTSACTDSSLSLFDDENLVGEQRHAEEENDTDMAGNNRQASA
jgi:hypothetical protein